MAMKPFEPVTGAPYPPHDNPAQPGARPRRADGTGAASIAAPESASALDPAERGAEADRRGNPGRARSQDGDSYRRSAPESAPSGGPDAFVPPGERSADGDPLTDDEQREVDALERRDNEVRTHEQAHVAAAGPLYRGGPTYDFDTGPDGKRYAVGGSVQIDTAPVPEDPAATIAKADRIVRAALAPAEPSGADRAVAQKARQMRAEASRELAEERAAEADSARSASDTARSAATSEPPAAPKAGPVAAPDAPSPLAAVFPAERTVASVVGSTDAEPPQRRIEAPPPPERAATPSASEAQALEPPRTAGGVKPRFRIDALASDAAERNERETSSAGPRTAELRSTPAETLYTKPTDALYTKPTEALYSKPTEALLTPAPQRTHVDAWG